MKNINIESLITILFIFLFVFSFLKKIIKRDSRLMKIIFAFVSIVISIIFFSIFFSMFLLNFFSFEFFPPIVDFELLIKIFISIIFTLVIVSVVFAILKNTFPKSEKNFENELLKSNLDEKNFDAFKKLGASPNMAYSKINELLYEKIKKINSDPKLSLIEKEKKIKELDEAFEIISEYYKSKN